MAKKTPPQLQVPALHNWRTTDDDEVNRRRIRARTDEFRILNDTPQHPVFSNFRVSSASGMTYGVEIRDVASRQFACECVDFCINGLGTCKHVEAVLLHLQARFRKLFETAARSGSTRLDVVPDLESGSVKLTGIRGMLPRALRPWFEADGSHRNGAHNETVAGLERLKSSGMPELRLSQELGPWLENARRVIERKQLTVDYSLLRRRNLSVQQRIVNSE